MSEGRLGFEPGGSSGSPRGQAPIQCGSACHRGLLRPAVWDLAGTGLTGLLELGARREQPRGALRCPWRPWPYRVESVLSLNPLGGLGWITVAGQVQAPPLSPQHLTAREGVWKVGFQV